MPKGYTKFTKYENELLRANKKLRKAVARIEAAAKELEARPDPVITPKPKKAAAKVSKARTARQLQSPGTKPRKAAKRRKQS